MPKIIQILLNNTSCMLAVSVFKIIIQTDIFYHPMFHMKYIFIFNTILFKWRGYFLNHMIGNRNTAGTPTAGAWGIDSASAMVLDDLISRNLTQPAAGFSAPIAV